MDNKTLKRIEDFIQGKSEEEMSLLFLKPGATDEVGANVIMQLLTKNGHNVIFYGPATYTQENACIHYKEMFDAFSADPNGKFSFFPTVVDYITRAPIYGFIVAGEENTIADVKALCGATKDPAEGTMRNELFRQLKMPYDKNENRIHASGKKEEAKREIANFMSRALAFPENDHSFDCLNELVESFQDMAKFKD